VDDVAKGEEAKKRGSKLVKSDTKKMVLPVACPVVFVS
jgi:hypothetical protein